MLSLPQENQHANSRKHHTCRDDNRMRVGFRHRASRKQQSLAKGYYPENGKNDERQAVQKSIRGLALQQIPNQHSDDVRRKKSDGASQPHDNRSG